MASEQATGPTTPPTGHRDRRTSRGCAGRAGRLNGPAGGYVLDMSSHQATPASTRRRRTGAAVGALALVATLAACDGDDDVTDDVDDAIDDAVTDIEEGVDDVSGAVGDAIDEVGEDTVELAARNLASTHGADEFADAGHPIDGGLTCEADATDDLTAVELECAGVTEDGGVASMTGTTTELPGESITELEGDFVGFVDTEEIFRTDALG